MYNKQRYFYIVYTCVYMNNIYTYMRIYIHMSYMLCLIPILPTINTTPKSKIEVGSREVSFFGGSRRVLLVLGFPKKCYKQKSSLVGLLQSFPFRFVHCLHSTVVGGWTNPSERYLVKLDYFSWDPGWKWKIFEVSPPREFSLFTIAVHTWPTVILPMNHLLKRFIAGKMK